MRIVVVNYIPLGPPSHIVTAYAKRGNILGFSIKVGTVKDMS